MCILFLAVNQHKTYPLVVLANRDEYFARPSRAMHRWSDNNEILAGRDLRSMGTWLGVNSDGRFCAVTNLRSPSAPANKASRGALVSRYLENRENHSQFNEFLLSEYDEYNPFNLIYGSINNLQVFSSATAQPRPMETGFHAISNGVPGKPWPKMSRGVRNLASAVLDFDPGEPTTLLDIMQDGAKAPDNLLPQTGILPEREKALSSIFIKGQDYGTRSTTLLYFATDHLRIYEYTYHPNKADADAQSFVLPLG